MKHKQELIQTMVLVALGVTSVAVAQDRPTRIEPGTTIGVRTNQFIDSDRGDGRVYAGSVTRDVRGQNGRVAIPAGSPVEMMVRVERDNDLILDLESVTVNGQRYAIQTSANKVDAGNNRDESPLVGAIVGALTGGQARGREVRIPQGTILNFKIEQPMVVGVADRGQMRGGYHYHDDYADRDRGGVTRIEPGTTISVRTNQFIDSDRGDNRVYNGTVATDIRGGNGRLAIPAGSPVELIVRVERDNDLILDLESVTVNGQRFGLETTANKIESGRDNSLVGAIVGAINGGQVRGREVRIPQGSVLNFQLRQPMVLGVPDRGETRDGYHYHPYDRRDR